MVQKLIIKVISSERMNCWSFHLNFQKTLFMVNHFCGLLTFYYAFLSNSEKQNITDYLWNTLMFQTQYTLSHCYSIFIPIFPIIFSKNETPTIDHQHHPILYNTKYKINLFIIFHKFNIRITCSNWYQTLNNNI